MFGKKLKGHMLEHPKIQKESEGHDIKSERQNEVNEARI